MPAPILENLEKLLAAGKDGALLRLGLGNEYLKLGQTEAAVAHLQRAVELDPAYSAAWKALGKALAAAGRHGDAAEAFRQGIAVATAKGDIQAAKEMTVFARRLEKADGGGGG